MNKEQLIEVLSESREIIIKDNVTEIKTEVLKLHEILNSNMSISTQALKIVAGIWTQICLVEDICNCGTESIRKHLA